MAFRRGRRGGRRVGGRRGRRGFVRRGRSMKSRRRVRPLRIGYRM